MEKLFATLQISKNDKGKNKGYAKNHFIEKVDSVVFLFHDLILMMHSASHKIYLTALCSTSVLTAQVLLNSLLDINYSLIPGSLNASVLGICMLDRILE